MLSRHENHRQEKTLGFSLRKAKESAQGRRSRYSQKNAVGKIQQKAQNAIYRGTAPRKTKRTATPSLKRHAAWEYPESAAHHKCLFGFRTPTRHVAQPDKRSIRFQKTNYFLSRPFFLGQNRQVKKGGIVGTPPSEPRGTHLTVTHGTHLSSGSSSSGPSHKAHMARFFGLLQGRSNDTYKHIIRTTYTIHLDDQGLPQGIPNGTYKHIIQTIYTMHPDDQHRSFEYNGPDH